MIIDLILNRRDVENLEYVEVCDTKFDDFYKPVVEVYPLENVPENLRNGYVYQYDPRVMYYEVLEHENTFNLNHEISAAMDYGTESDVKKALCNYIDNQNYNPGIKDYINSVNWL